MNVEVSKLAERSSAGYPKSKQPVSRWYAAYTCPRHEKYVARQLDERCIDTFVPLYRSLRRWKDRRTQIELPLFPGYVFVHFNLEQRLRILELPGVVRLVSFNGQPATLPEYEIETLRKGWTCRSTPNLVLICTWAEGYACCMGPWLYGRHSSAEKR